MTVMRRLAVVALTGILLVGCSDGKGADGDSASPASWPPSSAGTDAAKRPTLPTDCSTLGSEATRAETTEYLELYDAAPELLGPEPESATVALGCEWFGGDVTGISLTISTATPDAVAAAARTLGSPDYECAEDLGGRLCTVSEETPLDGGGTIATQKMVFARDGVWIVMSTSNMDGRALFSEIVADIVD